MRTDSIPQKFCGNSADLVLGSLLQAVIARGNAVVTYRYYVFVCMQNIIKNNKKHRTHINSETFHDAYIGKSEPRYLTNEHRGCGVHVHSYRLFMSALNITVCMRNVCAYSYNIDCTCISLRLTW